MSQNQSVVLHFLDIYLALSSANLHKWQILCENCFPEVLQVKLWDPFDILNGQVQAAHVPLN